MHRLTSYDYVLYMSCTTPGIKKPHSWSYSHVEPTFFAPPPHQSNVKARYLEKIPLVPYSGGGSGDGGGYGSE
jgi:hypothetical protein